MIILYTHHLLFHLSYRRILKVFSIWDGSFCVIKGGWLDERKVGTGLHVTYSLFPNKVSLG